jgi:hypothetical protein
MLLHMHRALRCHAKSKRSGLQCQAPAVRGLSLPDARSWRRRSWRQQERPQAWGLHRRDARPEKRNSGPRPDGPRDDGRDRIGRDGAKIVSNVSTSADRRSTVRIGAPRSCTVVPFGPCAFSRRSATYGATRSASCLTRQEAPWFLFALTSGRQKKTRPRDNNFQSFICYSRRNAEPPSAS